MGLQNPARYAGRALAIVSGSFLGRSVAVADVVIRNLLGEQHELNPELAEAMLAPRANDLAPDLVLVDADLAISIVVADVSEVAERAPSVLVPTYVERISYPALTPFSLARSSSTHVSTSRH
jgi:hypothetical protein